MSSFLSLPRPGTTSFRLLAGLVIGLVVTGLGAVMLAIAPLDAFRQLTNDLFLRVGQAPPADEVAVLELDRELIRQAGGWPLPLETHAEIVSELTDRGAAVIVYDLVFDLPREGIDELAEAVAASSGRTALASAGARLRTPTEDGGLYQIEDVAFPADPLAAATEVVGHANVIADAGGIVRDVPVIAETDRRAFSPALALAAVARFEGAESIIPTDRRDGRGGPRIGVSIGDRFVRTRPDGTMGIDWADGLEGTDAGAAVTACQLLQCTPDVPEVSQDAFDGRIVFVGPADPLVGDLDLTPVAKAGGAPGVYIHANAAHTILTGRYREPLNTGDSLLPLAVMSLLIATIAMFLPLWGGPVLLIGGIAVTAVWASLEFDRLQHIDLLYPIGGMVLAVGGAVAVKYMTERRDRRRVAALFSQYVPASVADQLVDEGTFAEAIEGTRQDITVFFCDLRGFTATSAEMEPADVRRMLAVFYEVATNLVLEHGGTLMQYVGDEVFAVFGVPIPQTDHAERAVACAARLQDARVQIVRRLAEQGLPAIQFGIGLNSGTVVAAHVGTPLRKQYSVIGDTVNVGARLCSLAGPNEIVISGRVSDRMDEPPPGEPLGPVELKGVSEDPRATWIDWASLLPGK